MFFFMTEGIQAAKPRVIPPGYTRLPHKVHTGKTQGYRDLNQRPTGSKHGPRGIPPAPQLGAHKCSGAESHWSANRLVSCLTLLIILPLDGQIMPIWHKIANKSSRAQLASNGHTSVMRPKVTGWPTSQLAMLYNTYVRRQ